VEKACIDQSAMKLLDGRALACSCSPSEPRNKQSSFDVWKHFPRIIIAYLHQTNKQTNSFRKGLETTTVRMPVPSLALSIVLLFLLLSLQSIIDASPPIADRPSITRPMRHYTDIHPVESDVPFIFCSVCKRAVRQLISQTNKKKKKQAMMSELDYLDGMKNLCDPLEDEGFWITELDIVETEDQALDVKRMNSPGHCEEECKTIALACQRVFDSADSEIAEILYLNKSTTATPESICAIPELRSNKGACGTTIPKVPSSRPNRGSNFRPKTKADFEREQRAAEQLLYGGSSSPDADLGDEGEKNAGELRPKSKNDDSGSDITREEL